VYVCVGFTVCDQPLAASWQVSCVCRVCICVYTHVCIVVCVLPYDAYMYVYTCQHMRRRIHVCHMRRRIHVYRVCVLPYDA